MHARSGLKHSLNLLTSSIHTLQTLIDMGSNSIKSRPANVLTLDSATYAMPVANTSCERSTKLHSQVKFLVIYVLLLRMLV